MKEFKGTKGKWSVFKKLDEFAITTIDETQAVCFMPDLYTYSEANAKLIASAPEMFKELKETIIDLKILKNQIIDANKTNHLFDGMPELMEKWIERKQQLLTKITD